MKKSLLRHSLACIFGLALLIGLDNLAYTQPFAEPASEDTTNFGRGLQRTMHLLATSTAAKKNTVKILVYGQSISHGTWWLQVREDLKKRFPHANLIMENKAIGGFSSKQLFVPFKNDVLPYNYDLVLFHVYGNESTYDSILGNIRRYTTAEIAIQNDHGVKSTIPGAEQWSYSTLPLFTQKYRLEMMDVRTPWTKYVADNNITGNDLTTDGTHLNDQGNYLMAALINRHLAYKPKFPTDRYNLVQTFEVGKDIFFENGKLNLGFDGTRIEFISGNTGVTPAPVNVLVDGKKPSEFLGCSYHLRANDSTQVPKYFELHVKDTKRIDWPWNVGTVLAMKSTVPLLEEDWTITINNLTKTANACRFDFQLVGSVTGNDGGGTVNMAKNNTDSSLYDWVGTSPVFVSNSKRVVIGSSAWYIPNAIDNGQPKVLPIVSGYKIRWHSTLQATDNYIAPAITDATIETSTVIAHGLPKGTHKLELEAPVGGSSAIKYIRVFNPYYDRPKSLLQVDAIAAQNAISLYPNPATSEINIDLQEYAGKAVKMDVYNILGEYVDKFENNSEAVLTMNTSALNAGLYHLRIDLGNAVVINKKFNLVK